MSQNHSEFTRLINEIRSRKKKGNGGNNIGKLLCVFVKFTPLVCVSVNISYLEIFLQSCFRTWKYFFNLVFVPRNISSILFSCLEIFLQSCFRTWKYFFNLVFVPGNISSILFSYLEIFLQSCFDRFGL